MDDKQLSFIPQRPLLGDEAIIAQAYDEVVVRIARLAPYGVVGEITELGNDVTKRQTKFAIDDLIHLAISGRRLLHAVSATDDASNIRLPEIQWLHHRGQIHGYRFASMLRVTRALNKLVHSVSIQIIAYDFANIDLTEEALIARWLRGSPAKLMPVCVVTDEKEHTLRFHIGGLCDAMSEVLTLAAERAAEHQLFLEDY